MTMNALNGVQSDTCILQIVTQQELRKMTKNLSKRLDFKDIKLPVKTKDIHKIEKKKRKKNIRSMYEKYVVKTSMLIYYQQENEA